MKTKLIVLAAFVTLGLAGTAYAGEGTGTSNSQGANSGGNATSNGATPQPH